MLRRSGRGLIWLAVASLWASALLTTGARGVSSRSCAAAQSERCRVSDATLAEDGTPTATATETPTPEPSATPTPTLSPEPTATHSVTPSVTPTATPTPEPTVPITPTATPTLTPTAQIQFWVDDDRISAGNCVDLYWQTSNVSAVHFDGRQVLESDTYRTCPCFDETHVLDVTLLDGGHDIRYITISVKGTCATPTVKPTKRPPKPTPEPTATPSPIPSSGDIADPSRPRSSALEGNWAQAVNLSLSGAASQPRIVAAPDGRLWVFWWDEFNGLVTTSSDPAPSGPGTAWTPPVVAPIVVTELVGEGDEAEEVSYTVEEMPTIEGAGEYAHAFWLGKPDEDTGLRPLMHSRIWLYSRLTESTIGAWSQPQVLAETALVWSVTRASDGTIHLAYVRPVHSEIFPAGIYHKRSLDSGASWGPPTVLFGDIYYRRLVAEQAHLTVTADDQARVFLIWDDPRLEKSLLVLSVDGGASWGEPTMLRADLADAAAITAGSDDGVRQARVLAAGSVDLLLWQQSGAAAGCALYQQELLTTTPSLIAEWGPAQRILESLTSCPTPPAFLRAGGGDPLILIGSGGEALTLAARSGSADPAASAGGWSEPKSLNFSFQHPELDRQVFLDNLRVSLADTKVTLVGLGQHDDVWYLESAIDTWEWAFAPPPEWMGPLIIGQSAGYPGVPATVTDAQGGLHAIWSEAPSAGARSTTIAYARLGGDRTAFAGADGPSAQWSRPSQVLQSPEGRAEQPALAGYEDLLYAVWIGGQGDRIYASQAYVQDAYAAGGWSQPEEIPLAGVSASAPSLLVDAYGNLHLVYASPLNEGRGIYYVLSERPTRDQRSGNGRIRPWSQPSVVFDAQANAWAMVDHPVLALDPVGTLHVAWVRGSSEGPFPPEGILYAKSTDGGLTWSSPLQMAEGAYHRPRIAAPVAGQVHILWSEVDGGDSWTHRWSADNGDTFSFQQQVRGFQDVAGPVGLATEGNGILHLVGLGRDVSDRSALAYSVWRPEEERWEGQESSRVGQIEAALPGVALTLQGRDGWLDAVFRAQVAGEDGVRPALVHARR
ncbi:MAG: hypothetical protein PVH41_14820, partial [Anaerolineae bacterium]